MLTQYEYDGFARLSRIISPSNQVTEIFYDDAYVNEWGQKAQKRTLIDPLGNRTEEIFDNFGHVIKVAKKNRAGDLLAETESFYDISGNKVLERVSRVSSEGLLSNYETEWSFNQRGQLQSVTRGRGTPQGRVTTFEYNPMEILSLDIIQVLKNLSLIDMIPMRTCAQFPIKKGRKRSPINLSMTRKQISR